MEQSTVSLLLQALPYIQTFKGRLFVVKMGGEVVVDPTNLDAIAQDLTLLQLVGVRVVVIHGGGPQANVLSEKLGFQPVIVEGRRVTDENALEVVKMVFGGKINTEILSALRRHGGRGVGLSGVDGGLIRARRRGAQVLRGPGHAGKTVDLGHVGDVEGVDGSLLSDLVDRGYIPVVCSLGADETGNILNINADTVAAEIAISLKAEKLVNLTTVPGVFLDSAREELVSVLTERQAEDAIRRGVIAGGMIPKVESCLHALRGGVRKAHILNGLEGHSLLVETFTRKGAGTMLVREGDAEEKPG